MSLTQKLDKLAISGWALINILKAYRNEIVIQFFETYFQNNYQPFGIKDDIALKERELSGKALLFIWVWGNTRETEKQKTSESEHMPQPVGKIINDSQSRCSGV